MFYYKKTSRELKHRLRDASGSSTSTVVESVVSEKQPVTRTHSERSRDINSLAQSEEKRVSVERVASPELQTNKVLLNENFYLPPVQRSIQDEKKSKNSQKDEPKSQKSQKGNYDRLITQEEQRRLKVVVYLLIQVFTSVEMILAFTGGRDKDFCNFINFATCKALVSSQLCHTPPSLKLLGEEESTSLLPQVCH